MATTSRQAADSHDAERQRAEQTQRDKDAADRARQHRETDASGSAGTATRQHKGEPKPRENDPAVIDQEVEVERGGVKETILEHRPLEHANITNPGPEKQTRTVDEHVQAAKAAAPDANRFASAEPVELAQGDPDSIRRFEQLKKERDAGENPEDQVQPTEE